jgi:hypothetical protein
VRHSFESVVGCDVGVLRKTTALLVLAWFQTLRNVEFVLAHENVELFGEHIGVHLLSYLQWHAQ